MAQKIRDYVKLAHDIIQRVGGKENIVNVSRCATRLRLVLTETPEGAKEKIAEMPGVITVVEKGGQFEVVIGNRVGEVYEEVVKVLGLEADMEGMAAENKQSILNRLIATMSAVFAPLVYLLAASGMLQGVLIVIKTIVPSAANAGTFQIFDLMSWAPFTFLPLFISISAAKHFKCNPYIALVCCCALISPTFTSIIEQISEGGSFHLFGIQLAETAYTSTVIPAIVLVWALSYLERFVKKQLPDVIKQLLTPLICYVIMVPLTLLMIGPVSELIANGIATGYNLLSAHVPVVTAAVAGGIWQVFVIFGVHWGITPVVLAEFAQNGSNSLNLYTAFAVAAQTGAALGVAIKAKNKEMKNVALSAGITGIFGITEPAIYGVTLRLKKPFICGCIAGAAASVFGCLMKATHYVYAGLPGPITFVNAIGPGDMRSFAGAVIGTVIAIAGAIILVQIVGFDDAKEKEASSKKLTADNKEMRKEDITELENEGSKEGIESPMTGLVISLSEIHDKVFSGGAMGSGAAVIPNEGKVYAPADGTITMLFDTYHAMGIRTNQGVELLIHVGIDTVKLNGKYFTPHTEVGASVRKGDLLLEFDMEKIEEEGYEIVTPVVVQMYLKE